MKNSNRESPDSKKYRAIFIVTSVVVLVILAAPLYGVISWKIFHQPTFFSLSMNCNMENMVFPATEKNQSLIGVMNAWKDLFGSVCK